jgi:hypothetical protein
MQMAPHPPHSPHLAPSDFSLFGYAEGCLANSKGLVARKENELQARAEELESLRRQQAATVQELQSKPKT